jgi:hypothetical protein
MGGGIILKQIFTNRKLIIIGRRGGEREERTTASVEIVSGKGKIGYETEEKHTSGGRDKT